MQGMVRNAGLRGTVAMLASAGLVACGGGGGDGNPIAVPLNNGLAAERAAAFSVPSSSLTQYQLHLDNATANAGAAASPDEAAPLMAWIRYQWCFGAENTGAPPQLGNATVVPMTKVFDDVWFTGTRSVGQYIFKTARGPFLIDTLNNAGRVQSITEPGMRSVGLDPATIIGALPTHGHGDHDGGAAYLQTTYRTPIYLGSGDAAGKTFLVSALNTDVLTPQPVAFSDLQMILLSTPGHTPGTFSGVTPVKHNGTSYKLAFWGGTAFSNTVAGSRNYLDGTERMFRLAREQKVDGTYHTHGFVDGSLRHIDQIAAGTTGGQNPFLIGNENALRSLATLRSCAAAKAAQVDATAVIPEWRFSTMDLASTWIKGQSNNLSASARVKSPYGRVETGTVEFSFAPGNEKCSAAIDASTGIATCTVTSTELTQSAVTASFAGRETASVVNLPAVASTVPVALN